MDSALLSDLIGSGLINKKSRVLCFRDMDGTMHTWLSRRRIAATVAQDLARSMSRGNNYHDVVLVHWEPGHGMAAEDQDQVLRDAMRWVRPACCLLVFYEEDGLFEGVSVEDAVARLRACFKSEELHSIQPLPRRQGDGAFGISLKKGGAYKPRCPVAYIDAADAFARCCETLMREMCIGLDVETTLKEPRILCTTQLATQSRVYVMDMLPIKDLTPLQHLMENKAVLKIIHNKSFEQKVLGHYGIRIISVYDTLAEARKRRKKDQVGGHKLGEVCERELGVYLDKSLQASDWTRRPLTPEQLDYAAADAEVLIRLYHVFEPPPPPETMALF